MACFFFSIIFSIGIAVVSSFTFWTVNNALDFYKPIIIFLGAFIVSIGLLFFVYYIISRIISNPKKEYKKPSKLARSLFISALRYICFLAGIRVKVIGKEKIPHSGRFLLVCNHKSKFDPMLTTALFGDKDLAFVTKKENMNIPIGNRFMHRLCYLPIDREDKLQSLEEFKKASLLISNNYSSVGIYPEGKRYEDITLGDFHEGVFSIALQSKCPILICTIKGTENIHKNFPKKKSKISFTIIGELSFEEIEGRTSKSISDQVRGIMLSNLEK